MYASVFWDTGDDRLCMSFQLFPLTLSAVWTGARADNRRWQRFYSKVRLVHFAASALIELAGFGCYKFDYSRFFGEPKDGCKLLILLVGERGFEPPTPWSRTRSQCLLELAEI